MNAPLVRLSPFEGMCLTAEDLRVEQAHHRAALARHARFLAGQGVVAGLVVELHEEEDAVRVRIGPGFGLTPTGRAVEVLEAREEQLEVGSGQGDLLLCLVPVDVPDPSSVRPVLDGPGQQAARIREDCRVCLRPAEGPGGDDVVLAWLRVRLGRVSRLPRPVPRARGVDDPAVSALEPVVRELVEDLRSWLAERVDGSAGGRAGWRVQHATAVVAAAEVRLVEPGASDRALLGIAALVVTAAHGALDGMGGADRDAHLVEQLGALKAAIPPAGAALGGWQPWFERLARLAPAVRRVARGEAG